MKYIIFIESIKEKEGLVGAIIEHDIKFNPDYKDVITYFVKITNCIGFKKILTDISKIIKENDFLIVHIDSHANKYELGFRNDPNIEDEQNILNWDSVVKMCNSLFGKLYDRALFVFASCESALFYKNESARLYSVIAAENQVDSDRMKEQLLVFYNSFCSGLCFEQAYNSMIQKYPIEAELERDEKKRSILRFFKCHATTTN